MRVSFIHIEARRYTATAVRPDGISVAITGHGFAHRMPRDLAHFAVEEALDMRHGMWGSIAAGGLLPGVSVAEGQPLAAGAADKGRAVADAMAQSVTEARTLVAAFDEIVTQNLEGRWPQVDPALQVLTTRRGSRLAPLTKTDVSRVAVAWRALQARWDQVAVGETLQLDWKVQLMSGGWPAIQ
jgi:hypothetical protein